MTEDMRERTLNMCDKHTVQLFAGENCDICRMQAALSSAGTSGTCPECQSPDRAIRYCSECNLPLTDHTHPTSAFVACRNSWHGGDSLSGKGEAFAAILPENAEPKLDMRMEDEPSAPDRAEELARKIVELVNGENGTGWDERFDNRIIAAVAALLREAEGRWIPVSERFPAKERPVLTFSPRLGMTPFIEVMSWSFDEEDQKVSWYEQDGDWWGNEVTHWQPLPAPPRGTGWKVKS